MCGIFGFVSSRVGEANLVLDGLKYLEYRGYDSWGIAVSHNGSAVTQKEVGRIGVAETSLPASLAALGHTRWATHGQVTKANAHPHSDCRERLALIHNGIVENHQQLRGLLQREHTWRSQTDTEVLVHLLEEALDSIPDLLDALVTVFRLVEGLSAVAVLDAQTKQLAVAKNGSPLAVGRSEGRTYLASDAMALLDHTRKISYLEDGQAAALYPDDVRVVDVRTGAGLQLPIREVAWNMAQTGLDGFAHFMTKEIHEQPKVVNDVADGMLGDASVLADMIRESRDIFLIGCGTAHHAAMSGRYMLAEIAGVNAQALVASESSLALPLMRSDSLVIAFSQSGETIDVLEAVRAAQRHGARVAALVNSPESSLARIADLTILLGCGAERCVLATKSYSAKLAVMHLASRALCGEIEVGAAELRTVSVGLHRLLERLDSDGLIQATARRMGAEQHMFVLGRHRNYPLALEAALKIKEVSYLHAEGFPAGELKHGVIALVTYGTPCLILAPDDDFRRETLAAAAEVRARGALTVGFSDREQEEFDITIPITGGVAAPFEIAVASQMIAYELALLRGCDPDKPRNLAKSVTVK